MRLAAFLLAMAASTVCWLTSALAADPVSADRAYVDSVLDGLVRQGVLTADQAAAIKADAAQATAGVAEAAKPKPKWTDTIKLSGYTQARWNYHPDADEVSNDFEVRRSRIKLAAQPTPRTEVELQLDLGEGEVTVKDAWAQYDLTVDGACRVRAGQQKVPFGFEGPQSSSNRVPLERNWVARRMIPGERDTGVTLYWTDPDDAALFDEVKKTGFGEGDYGNVALGFYNGQGIEDGAEVNDSKHLAVRLAKPFRVADRVAEAGASYYGGRYHSPAGSGADFSEHLVALHAYLPPDPVGIQAEWFTGRTEGDDVDGFYAMGLYRPSDDGVAFVRYDQYNGPRKGKGAGNVYDRERWSVGYAHMLDEKTEVTVEYDIDDTATGNDDLLGVQLQVGY
jgi:hypothetical protein